MDRYKTRLLPYRNHFISYSFGSPTQMTDLSNGCEVHIFKWISWGRSVSRTTSGLCCKRAWRWKKHALHGLKQSPMAWYSRVINYFKENKLVRCPNKYTLYVKEKKNAGILIAWLYVVWSDLYKWQSSHVWWF